jgi:hypothetical protein
MHFGTFRMAGEGIDAPQQALAEACRVNDVSPSQFRTLDFGETIRLG